LVSFPRKASSEGRTFVINFALASPARVRKRSKASFSNLALKE
jgi:hypothetical protein